MVDYKSLLSTKGLFQNTSWPTDHADNKRSKFYPGGLKFDPSRSVEEQIGVISSKPNEKIFDPQWMYTREKDQLYVYGGRVIGRYLARFNALTMELEQLYNMPNAFYQGGAIMHENGDVYTITANIVYRFRGGDLKNPEQVVLPHLNGNFLTISNGLLTLENGLIVIKLFAFNFWDFIRLFAHLIDHLVAPAIALGLIFLAELLFFGGTALISFFLEALVFLFVFILIGTIVFDEFVPEEKTTGFKFHNLLKIQPGRFILLDPETLKIVFLHDFPDKCTYARLSISPKKDDKQEIVVLGDHIVQKYVYSYVDQSCQLVPDWEKYYRRPEHISSRGTGPTTVERDVYFTNNTYPETWHCDNYQIFKMNLDDPSVFKWYDLTPKGKKRIYVVVSCFKSPHKRSVSLGFASFQGLLL